MLLLLHGEDGLRPSLVDRLTDQLASTDRVLAPDLPGCGESGPPAAANTQLTHLDFVASLVDGLGLSKASLMGVSLGGSIALGMALCAPEWARRLVLVDSCGLQSRAPAHRLFYLSLRTPW